MGCVLRAWFFLGSIDPPTAKRVLEPLARHLRTGRSTDTVDRLFESQHVSDLRLIAAVALIVVGWAGFFSALFAVDGAFVLARSGPELHGTPLAADLIITAVRDFLELFAPVLAVFGGMMAWAYQVGSARLGVVDLFACEIDTLCRMTTVTDMVGRQVALFNSGPPVRPGGRHGSILPLSQFVSQENYFPVFDNNSRDLQSLEARVVINITAFYTYMKAVRDCLRKLADVKPLAVESHQPVDEAAMAGPWHDSLRNMLYMLYLALESARKAINDLVEYEPEQAERTMVVLISELKAYRFLCGQYVNPQEMRHQRLKLRAADYVVLVRGLHTLVENSQPPPHDAHEAQTQDERLWHQAFQLLHELEQRYADLAVTTTGERPTAEAA